MRRSLVSAALAACLAVGFCAPSQIHSAFAGLDAAGTSNGFSVSWATPNATETSQLWYGLTPSSLTQFVNGYTVSYFPPEVHHHAVVSGLQPATTYYYKVGDAVDGYSEVFTFTVAPNYATQSFNVAIFGDLGYGVDGNAVETRAQLDRVYSEYDWILHVGDIGYADDYYLHDPFKFGYEEVYDNYMAWMQNVTANKAYMVLPGNHEGECHSPICLLNDKYKEALRNFTAYNARFRMPAPESDAHGENMWYSFNYGPVHFIQFDTETDYPNAPMATSCPLLPCGNFGPNNAQLTWLEQDLAQAQADRKLRPWIFVSGHRPIYRTDDMNPDGSPSGEAYNLQQALEGLFAKYDVDMYFAGHKHSYQRTYPVLNNTVETSYVNPKFPVHLIVGGAGCDEMSGKTATNPLGDGDSDPAWLAAKDTTHYGMGILNVYNATTVRWTWYESKDGSVLDQITLVKDSH